MADSRGRRPVVAIGAVRCLSCSDVLAEGGRAGEADLICRRTKCRQRGVKTPLRPPGWVPVPDGIDREAAIRVLEAVRGGLIPVDPYLDPLFFYRQIPDLFVMGPAEIEQAFLNPESEDNPNPLGLLEGWCRLLAPPVPVSADELYEKWVKPSQTPEWTDCIGGCKPVLSLMLREINIISGKVQSVSPANLCHWFGQRGLIRQIQLSDWFLAKDLEWVNLPIILQACWSMRWLDHPAWTTSKRWDQQQEAVTARQDIPGLRLGTGPEELWLMNILTANGLKFREKTWTRVLTIFDGCPLEVNLNPDGVLLIRHWDPGNAYPDVGAAVAGDLVA